MAHAIRWSEATIVAIDIECNGAQPQEMVEVAIVRIYEGKVQFPPRSWLIRPCEPVTRHAQRIHGISNRDLEGAPDISAVAGEIADSLGSFPVVGHQIGVDYRILVQNMPFWRPIAVFDTLKLSKIVIPTLPSYSLTALVNYMKLVEQLEGRSHRAGYDAVAAARLFIALMQVMDPAGKFTLDDLALQCGTGTTQRHVRNRQESLF